ncbi:MAG: ATP-binding protein [Candidatus Omnitrophica bacterium]|nr:ATP-binding protein [Candidatus Omnitrophota bacterium]
MVIILLGIILIFLFKLHTQSKLVQRLKISLAQKELELKKKTDSAGAGEAKLETVLSSMFEGVLVVDKEANIVLMNPSLRRVLLIDSPVEGKMALEVIRNVSIQEIVERTLKGEQDLISAEISLIAPEEKVFKINSAPIIRNNIIEGAILVFHDITQLRRLEKIRQDFVANVSHELRTPLTSIKGYAETLLEGAIEDKDNVKEFINIIYHDSNRLAHLIDDLLDLSKIESGKMKMSFAPLEIKAIAKDCVEVLKKQAKEKSISIYLDLPDNLPKVLADEKRLSQVFLNLLDNAIKYTPEGGSVKISASLKEKFVQIDVSDTGIGIPEEDLPRIFERFYRVDKARSRQLGGTGLCLSIVKHIILAHRGEVWVKSQLGIGSTFSFTLHKA